MENFCKTYNVSRETFSKLEQYCQSLIEWQQKFNLVSNGSLQDVWNRHFADSAQLFRYIPEKAGSLLDIGSGAGFPAMVLAIMAAEKTPYLKFTMVESISKKTLYLNHVKDITGVNAEILNTRAENIKNKKYEVITARAVTSLKDLLKYAFPLLKKGGICIFPKGKSYCEEIKEAQKQWIFSTEIFDSTTSDEGKILIIKNLMKKGRNNAQNNSRCQS